MQIESYSHPDPPILAQVRSLEHICQTHDQLKGRLFLDSSLNFSPEMPCLLALFEEGVSDAVDVRLAAGCVDRVRHRS